MGQRRGVQTKVETPLAAWRVARDMSQEEMAEATGISLSTYRRMERGKLDNPPIGYLINCAYVLGCKVFELVEPRHRGWFEFTADVQKPANPSRLWRAHRTPDTAAGGSQR